MSFRIEDILKKQPEKPETRTKFEPWPRVPPLPSVPGNILQQTLLHRPSAYFCAYKTIEDHHGKQLVKWPVEYDKSYYPTYYNPYLENVGVYSNLYSRSRIWNAHGASSLPVIFPFHYPHYSKRKGGQVRFTANQTDLLEKRFLSHKYLSPEDRKVLADSLKLTDRQVKTWFQNRRAKWRRSISSSNSDYTDDAEEPKTQEVCDSSAMP